MKKFTLSLFLLLGVLLLSEPAVYAQSSDNSRSDQAMSQLLDEVRLLRQDLRRLTTSTYRAHTIIERLRLQQDQISRVSNELIAVRAELAESKIDRIQLKEKIAITQQRVEDGIVPVADLNSLKRTLEALDQREPDLVVKESQLVGQLNIERANLEELQKKLDAIDLELQSLNKDDKRPKEKQQD